MPARRYLCSPQGGGKLTLTGLLLPPAQQGVAYSQNIAGQAHSGVVPYGFSLLSTSGSGDVWFVSTSGQITGTPIAQDLRITDSGDYRVTDTGDYRST